MEMAEEHSKRRHKRSNGEQNNGLSIDRISDLPDSVLTHILSFLTTKLSVRTSILGKRWRYLWSYVPNLVFDYENRDNINRVLLLSKVPKIDTFCVTNMAGGNKNQIDTWITFAVERNVQNLDLNCRKYDIYLPRCLFSCKTLVDLRLCCCGIIPKIGSVVCFPSLKKLSLIQIRYDGDESLPNLLSGSPVLEELEIHLVIDYNPCKISSRTIKRLVLYLHSDGGSDNQDYYHRLEINTPALAYLELCDCATQYIECGALNSLIEAHIYIWNNIKPDDDFLYSRSVVEFIDKLHNVKSLRLDLSKCTKIIDSVFSTWKSKSFYNLTKLELFGDCCFLSKFLENADNLEILILSKVRDEVKGWMEPQNVPACLLSHLRTIKLVGIEGKKHEFEIMRYLLRNAQTLETMEIRYPRIIDSNEKIYMLEEISLYERGSKACKVDFVPKQSVKKQEDG